MKLLSDCVLVKPDEADKYYGSLGGVKISIPESFQKKVKKGTVIEIGEGEYLEKAERKNPMTVKPGDRIMYKWYPYEMIDGNIIMREGDIYCVLED